MCVSCRFRLRWVGASCCAAVAGTRPPASSRARRPSPKAVPPASAATTALDGRESDCTATGSWRTRKPMTVPATFAATPALPDGRVFVVGGFAPCGKPRRLTNAVRVYDPKQDVLAEASHFAASRSDRPKQPRTNLLRCRRTEAPRFGFCLFDSLRDVSSGEPAGSRRPVNGRERHGCERAG